MSIVLILSLVVTVIGTGSFLWIKALYNKNKVLKFKVDYAEKEFEQVNENIKNYKLIIEKLNKKKVESEAVKDNISNATGNDLATLANLL